MKSQLVISLVNWKQAERCIPNKLWKMFPLISVMMKILQCCKFIEFLKEKTSSLPIIRTHGYVFLFTPLHFSDTLKIYVYDRISPAAPQLSKVARLDIFKPSLLNGC